MDNNSALICNATNTSNLLEKRFNIAVYQYLAPIYFVIGIICRSLTLLAFYKQYKKEKAFAYQVMAASFEIIEVLTSSCELCTTYFSGRRLPGFLWFQQNYPLMWYASILSTPIKHVFITTCLLISLSMAVDRVFALAKPFVYKNINHKRHQIIAVVICFTIGLSTSVFDLFRFQVCDLGDRYKICTNDIYVASTVAVVLVWIRTSVRIIANVALVFVNTAMVMYYRLKIVRAESAADRNDRRAAKRKATHKTLVILTVCESILTTSVMTILNIYYVITYTSPFIRQCFGNLMAPAGDLIIECVGSLKFFVIFIVSKQFRQAIIALFLSKENVNGQSNVSFISRLSSIQMSRR